MTKDDLIRELHQKLGKKHTMKDLTVSVNEMLNLMSEKLKRGEEIQVADFSTFSVAEKTIKSVVY